ncbi:MAG: HEAT repeat domain-containing protein [Planctomycetota bacterium]|jgi:HEAT repeat protein
MDAEYLALCARYGEAVKELESRPGAGKLAVALLQDKDKNVQGLCMRIVRDLTPAGAEKNVLAAIKAMKPDPTWPGTYSLPCMALAAYETPAAADCLLELLKTDCPRADVIRALGWVNQPKVAREIVAFLGDGDPTLAATVLEALARCGNPEVVAQIKAFLLKISADDAKVPATKRTDWQKAAFMALWVIQNDDETFDFIAEQLEEVKVEIEQEFRYRDFFHPDDLPPGLFKLYLKADWTPRFRLALRYMTETFGAASVDKDALRRWEERYKRVGNKAVPLLLDCLLDPNYDVSSGALQALRQRARHTSADEKKTIRAALKKLALSDAPKTYYLAQCLYAYRDGDTVELLERLSRVPDVPAAFEAAKALVLVDKAAGTRRLRDFLKAEAPALRWQAACNLVVAGDDAGLRVLFQAAEESDDNYAVGYADTIARHLKVGFDRYEFLKDRAKGLQRLKAAWKEKQDQDNPK